MKAAPLRSNYRTWKATWRQLRLQSFVSLDGSGKALLGNLPTRVINVSASSGGASSDGASSGTLHARATDSGGGRPTTQVSYYLVGCAYQGNESSTLRDYVLYV